MEYQELLFLTMTHNFHQWLLPSLLWVMAFTTTLVVPITPQSNEETERVVQTITSILNKATDPYLGLLSYRATPLANGYPPAELLMARKLYSTIPTLLKRYKPNLPRHSEILQKEQLYWSKQQTNFNKHHR